MSGQLWHVEIHDDDWDYDEFVAAVVWAESAGDAERIMREEPRKGPLSGVSVEPFHPWIKPEWRLTVTPAPTTGVALVHWHAG